MGKIDAVRKICLLIKVRFRKVKEVACDVLPVAMFSVNVLSENPQKLVREAGTINFWLLTFPHEL